MATNVYAGAGPAPAGADATWPALPAFFRRISWAAVFAGTIVAIMASLTLNTLGLAIGLATVDPMQEANPFAGLWIGSAIWWTASTAIALFIGGWVAARMSAVARAAASMLHGILVWGVVMLVTFYILTTAVGRVVGGAAGMLGQGLQVAGQGIAAVAPALADEVQQLLAQQDVEIQNLRQEITRILQAEAAGQQGLEAREALTIMNQALQAIIEGRENVLAPEQRQTVVNAIVARTDMGRQEAERMLQSWIQTAQQVAAQTRQAVQAVERQAEQIGGQVASGVSQASWWTFFALVLGGAAAALGGRIGKPEEPGAPAEERA